MAGNDVSTNCPKCGRFMRVTRYLIHIPGHQGWHVNHECGGRGCWHVIRAESSTEGQRSSPDPAPETGDHASTASAHSPSPHSSPSQS